jgi:hypothetical protein
LGTIRWRSVVCAELGNAPLDATFAGTSGFASHVLAEHGISSMCMYPRLTGTLQIVDNIGKLHHQRRTTSPLVLRTMIHFPPFGRRFVCPDLFSLRAAFHCDSCVCPSEISSLLVAANQSCIEVSFCLVIKANNIIGGPFGA